MIFPHFKGMVLLAAVAVAAGGFSPKPIPSSTTVAKDRKEAGRVFIVNAPVKDLDDFRELVKQAKALQPYGTVKINISTLADKGFHEIPEQGSPWHEYASANPTPGKFFPDPKLAPFIPAGFVKKNRQLLMEKAKILRENGLEAAFIGYEPNFLPAAFFEAHPAMLGPRVDHPRRSNQQAFAPCISVRETQEMYANMMAELLKNAPEITSFSFKTNDAGAGICWSDWLYSGPNGPTHCKRLSTGQRVQLLMNAFKAGAAKAGRELSIYMDAAASNFSDAERSDIEAHLPENCYFLGNKTRSIKNVGGLINATYPVTGIINPVALVNDLRSLDDNNNQTIFLGFRAAYDRGVDRPDMTGLAIKLLQRELKEAVSGDRTPTLQDVQQLSEEWAGKKDASTLFNAFVALNDAMTYKANAFPRVSTLYWGVTVRMINRPLIIAPKRLTEKEEAYFLPYVFNISKEEARMDYTDVHGVRVTVPPGVIANYVNRVKHVAAQFDALDAAAPKKEFFHRMALSLRIHASIIRSCGNFAYAQAIRDKDSALLNGPVHRSSKDPDWEGHPDFIAFNNIMRDELDNTQELIEVLENGGMKLLVYARDPVYEDPFILGPDLLNQLKKKRKIMLDHWTDIQDYLTSPFK